MFIPQYGEYTFTAHSWTVSYIRSLPSSVKASCKTFHNSCQSVTEHRKLFNYRDGWNKAKGPGTWITGWNAKFPHSSTQIPRAMSVGSVYFPHTHDASFERK